MLYRFRVATLTHDIHHINSNQILVHMDARHTQIILVLNACIFTISDRTHERVTNYQPVVMVCVKTFFYDMIYRMNLRIKKYDNYLFLTVVHTANFTHTRQYRRRRRRYTVVPLPSSLHRQFRSGLDALDSIEKSTIRKRNKRHTRMFMSTRIKREKKQYH